MKKKLLLVIISVLLVAILFSVMAGCTETFKQGAIPTEHSDKIASNGGLSVVYGNYLYFINGNAGNTDIDNVFGKPLKGAIARVSLKNGLPDGETQIVVPKIVYGTDKTYGGLYISNDYIYYSSPSAVRDGSGKQKSAKMEILRTKVDGTGTEKVLDFDDFSVVFAVSGDNLIYVRANELFKVALNTKSFKAEKVEQATLLGNYKLTSEYIVYCVNNEENSADQMMKAYNINGKNAPVVLMDSKMLRNEGMNTTYTITMIAAEEDATTLSAFFTLKDSELNAPEEGICSYTYDKNAISFEKSKMVRYTNNANTVTNLNYLMLRKMGDYVMAVSDKRVNIFNKDGSFLMVKARNSEEMIPVTVEFTAAVVLKDNVITDTSAILRYEMENALYSIKLFDIKDGKYTYVESNVQKLFAGTVDTSYCESEIINNVIYFMNSGISNNAYYYVIPTKFDKTTNLADVKLLGIVNRTDFIAAF